jgi:LysM repeat protein
MSRAHANPDLAVAPGIVTRISVRAAVCTVVAALAAGGMATPAQAAAGTPVAAVRAIAQPSFHVVRPGQTLLSIARQRQLRWRDLARWNSIRAPYRVYIDEILRLTRPAAKLPSFRTMIHIVTPEMINWNPQKGCPVGPGELRRIWVSYIDFNGNYHDGSIIIHRLYAVPAQKVFQTLYNRRFRIQAMSPMSINMPGFTDYSIVTAGYNCRRVSGSTTWSQHAYGTAIDINPVQNPMVRGASVSPATGAGYVIRSAYRRGMVHGSGAVTAFTANGFFWGGRWNSLQDYMHFSTTNR